MPTDTFQRHSVPKEMARSGTRLARSVPMENDLLGEAPYSHSIINSFGKSLSGLTLGSQRLIFTVILTVILTGIPKRSFHHRSTSITKHRRFQNRSLSRSIAVYRFAACDPAGGSSGSGSRVGIEKALASDGIKCCRIEAFWQFFRRHDAAERARRSVRICRRHHCFSRPPDLRKRLPKASLHDLRKVVRVQA